MEIQSSPTTDENLDAEDFFRGIDLIQRVKNFKLKPTDAGKALIPVLEAVINSIHSIEESGRPDGKIIIDIERIPQYSTDGNALEPIENFVIQDNGVGFDKKHFNAFVTSDTRYKYDDGGKGIGRFSWLKAFEKVSVESVYRENSHFYQRSFEFRISERGIHNLKIEETSEKDTKTTIKLCNYNIRFRSKAPKRTDAISRRIVEYCLFTFLSRKPPSIFLNDVFLGEKFLLNELLGSGIKADQKDVKFKCKKEVFNLKHIKIYSATEDADHRINLCGGNREVEREAIHKRVPFLRSKTRIQDENGKPFIYVGYLTSKYLDENISPERTEFDIPEEPTPLLEDVSRCEIVEQAIKLVESFLAPFAEAISKENRQRIEKAIEEKYRYRPLLNYKSKELDGIPPGLSDSQLEIELHKLLNELEREVIQKGEDFLCSDSPGNILEIESQKEKYLEFIEKHNAIGKSKLTEYVVHRKVMLELFEKKISVDPNGRYSLEKEVHALVFPMRKTSDQVLQEQQNLWIIDERLAYHRFLASDQPLSTYEGIDIQHNDRPDIAIFDSNLAFVKEESEYSSLIIVEFKRPMREEYSDDEDPIDQVLDYSEKIRLGKAKDLGGRFINVNENTPFYAYIICDLTPKIRKWARKIPLTPSPHNDGYFGYNSEYKTYLEIISFRKLVADARKRNQILFEKLNLPDVRH